MIMTLCTCLVCIKNVSFHKIHINEAFHCTCPTCYSVSFAINNQPQVKQPLQQEIDQDQASSGSSESASNTPK